MWNFLTRGEFPQDTLARRIRGASPLYTIIENLFDRKAFSFLWKRIKQKQYL
jgi:hypothetical protein